MANEFKVRKGLVVNGSGSVILDVQGSQGQLFSVTDQLSGSLFSVNDISGVPVLEAFSDSTVKIGQYLAEAIIVSGSTARITGSMSLAGFSTGSVLFAGTGGAISQNNSNFFWDAANSRLGIGTNAPDSTLSINGQVRFGNTTNGFFFSSNSISTFGNIFLGLQGDRSFQITDNTFASTYFRVIRNTGAILIGTTVDDGVNRLQVSGLSRFMGDLVITGSSTFNGNITLLGNISSLSFGGSIQAGNTFTFYSSNGNISAVSNLNISLTGNASGVGLSRTNNTTLTSGNSNFLTINSTGVAFAPTTGSATMTGIVVGLIVSQSGDANGITRGLHVAPNLISAWDFRAIEWTNNASATSGSWGLYGSGSAPNYLSGSLSIGTTAIGSNALTVSGSSQFGDDLTVFRNKNSNLALVINNPSVSTSGTQIILTNASRALYIGKNQGASLSAIGVTNVAANDSYIASVYGGDLNIVNQAGNINFAAVGSSIQAKLFTNGNFTIGSTTDDTSNRLQVTGNARISQTVTASQALISGSGTQRLIVVGSGSAQPLFTVQGSQGELFSIVDSLSGSLFSVNDQSGLPIMEVFSDNTTLVGNYLAPMLLTTNRTSSAAGINTIYSLPTSSYDAVYIDYTIRSGSNARAGNFMAMWSGTSVNFTDNSITEFGSTSAFTFGAHVSGANMVVTGSAPTAGWTIKTIIKAI